jgi:hypothetical protein
LSKKSQAAGVAFASVTTTTRCPPRVSTSQSESSRLTIDHSASSMTGACARDALRARCASAVRQQQRACPLIPSVSELGVRVKTTSLFAL